MCPTQKLAKPRCSKEDIQRAKSLRRSAPMAERLLWNELQLCNKSMPFHYRRQHPLSPYILDFVCLKAKIVIELDGPSHETRQEHDERRTAFIIEKGFEVLRFTNDDVTENLSGVVETILFHTQKRLS